MPKIDAATGLPLPSLDMVERVTAAPIAPPTKSGSARINMVATPAQLAQIKASCARNGLSMTTFLKQAINKELADIGEPIVEWGRKR